MMGEAGKQEDSVTLITKESHFRGFYFFGIMCTNESFASIKNAFKKINFDIILRAQQGGVFFSWWPNIFTALTIKI